MRNKQPEDQSNLLLAVVLSMAVLIAWQLFYAGPRMKAEQERIQQEQQLKQKSAGAPSSPAGTAAQPQGATPSDAAPQAPALPGAIATSAPGLTREAALALSPRVEIATSSLKGSIGLKGGLIDDVSLTKYREKVDPKSANVVLFSPFGSPRPYFVEYGWQNVPGANQTLPGSESVWKQEGSGSLTPQTPVTLTWDNGQGLLFSRRVSIDDNYMLTVTDGFDNNSGADVSLAPYARIYRIGTPKIEGFVIQHEGLIGVQGKDEGVKEITYSKALGPGETEFKDKAGGWVGFVDKYWASAIIPPQLKPFRATLDGQPHKGTDAEVYWADFGLDPLTAGPGASALAESRLFVGAKQPGIIDAYEAKYGIERFNKIVDWGYLYFITQPLFYVIDWLYLLVGNFGIAILMVTVIIKVLFFPLANRSYESMAKMKKLQPEMEKLKERFKDDKARQQQELMKLYQEQKINPLAGCLPILLQIPVFFALYKVIYISIDMRHAPFFGWIKDLSAPDPTSLFNLFGLLPFAAPDFLHLGVWPLIMGITMWLQMQLNPQQPDPTQQMIFNWMPVMFTFLLASFPAGLVIYWAWNNVLSLLQQSYIMKKQGTEIPLKNNIKKTFAPLIGLWNARFGAKS